MVEDSPTPPVILIVEDDPIVRVVAAEFIAEQGFEVLEAENANAALDLFNARSDIELLFTDINMPGKLDGLALAREVARRWPQVLLIITSGRGSLGYSLPATGEFIAKPYDFDKLAERIAELLKM